MPITRSYSNAFEIVDYTQELAVVPNSWTLLNDVGLFSEESLTTHTATFEEVNKTFSLIGDQTRGAKPAAMKDAIRKIRSYSIPHFPVVDAITPQDLQGKRAYGSPDAAETEAAVMVRKMEAIRKSFDITLEVARFRTLAAGDLYAPNGTIAGNLYTDFGVTQTSVNFDFGNASSNIIGHCEEVIATMQDNAFSGDVISGVVAYCSPTFFAGLISHAKVIDAYKYYSATAGQEILRNRAGNNGSLYREFTFGGIRFIEVRTILAGTTLVDADTAVFVPLGTTDVFKTYFGPANKIDLVNTLGERAYMFTYRSPKGEAVEIEAESNFLSVVKKPKLVIKGTIA